MSNVARIIFMIAVAVWAFIFFYSCSFKEVQFEITYVEIVDIKKVTGTRFEILYRDRWGTDCPVIVGDTTGFKIGQRMPALLKK